MDIINKQISNYQFLMANISKKFNKKSIEPTSYRANELRAGFSLVEIILAVGIIAVVVSVYVGALVFGQESTALAGQRARAVLLAEEGLEAAHNMRDEAFTNLSAGTHGLAVSGNQWIFSGTSDTNGIFTRSLEITTATANKKQLITSTVSWAQNQQRLATVSVNTGLTNWRASSARGGMLVFSNGGTISDIISYRVLSTAGTWGLLATAADIDVGSVNRALRAVQVYASSTRNEKIMLSRHYNGTTQSVYAQVYNGTSWGNVQLLSSWNAATFLDVQNFSGTYLNNGNFMAVFSDNTNIPKSRTWNGSSWSAQSSLSALTAAANVPNFIVLKARPGTNEAMAVFFDQASDTISQYWSGSAWSAITSHSAVAPVNNKRLVDFDWSPNDALVGGMIFSDSATDRSLAIKIWTANGTGGGAWSGAVNTANQGAGGTRLGAMSIVGRPGANTFVACDNNTVPQVICYQSSFTPAWTNPTNQIIAAATDTGIQRTFDISYESATGTTALGVYSDATVTPRLKKYTAGTTAWDAAATNLSALGAALETVRLRPLGNTDDIIILEGDTGQNLYTVVWDGTNDTVYTTPAGKAFTNHGAAGSADGEFWFDFAWDAF